MVASEQNSRHQCAIAIPAGNVEVCKVITCAYIFVVYSACTRYALHTTRVQSIDCIGQHLADS